MELSYHSQEGRRGEPVPRPRSRVMVVDDDPIIGSVLAGALNRGGYDAEVFTDSRQAFESFDRVELDLVVADWIMPGLDGLTFISAVKDRAPGLPTMLITGYKVDDAVRRACDEGRVDALLAKPFDLRNFMRTVAFFLNQDQEARPDEFWDRLPPLGGAALGGFSKALENRRLPLGRDAYYEQVLECVPDAVVMVDRRGRIIYANRGAKRMFGFQEPAAGRLFLGDFCPVDSRIPGFLSRCFQPRPQPAAQVEDIFLRANGQRFPALFSVSLFETAYQEPALLLAVKDVQHHHHQDPDQSERTRKLEKLAITDPLTGLYNRRHFDRRLEEEFKRVERYRSPLTLVMIDFDHFKRINDRFGHLVGDQVLKIAADKLGHGLREVDVLARWGGEEYMALLPETGGDTGLAVARRLREAIGGHPWRELEPDLAVTVSLGMVSLPWNRRPMSVSAALDALDRALYRAKNTGRDRLVCYLEESGSFETA